MDVILHGRDRNAELRRDVLVAKTATNERSHLAFALRQHPEQRTRRRSRRANDDDRASELARALEIERQRLAPGDRPPEANELLDRKAVTRREQTVERATDRANVPWAQRT